MIATLLAGLRQVARVAGVALAVAAGLLSGCKSLHPGFETSLISAKVEERAALGFDDVAQPGQLILPNGCALDDGLIEDEAVLIALWNNAAFQEVLRDLGVARG